VLESTNLNRSCPAVSHICSLTNVSLSSSTTRLVMKLAPTVLVVLAGVNWFLIYRYKRLVFPTPCAPNTTILASKDCAMFNRRYDYPKKEWGSKRRFRRGGGVAGLRLRAAARLEG
jgi:hypothetical protein